MQFHIDEPGRSRPDARAVVFCDGSADESFREGIDLELSHWVPNRTPRSLKADTSTEICMLAAEQGLVRNFDLVVNNHVDVDGVLSAFTLLHPDLAVGHRRTVVQAAEIGDFYGWGDVPAQRLFQALALAIVGMRRQQKPMQAIYEYCFEQARRVLAGEVPAECGQGIADVARSAGLVEDGTIRREVLGARFVHYAIPRVTCENAIARSLFSPAFCQPFSADALLSPHVRASLDEQRIQLVSVEIAAGWYYDLFYPGYAWADTVNRWRPSGLSFTEDGNVSLLDHEPLTAAIARLRQLDSSAGDWRLASTLQIFSSDIARPFPIVLSHMGGGVPVPSALPPQQVASVLAQAFAEETVREVA